MANLYAYDKTETNGSKWKRLKATESDGGYILDVVVNDANGAVDFSNIELILPTPLKADRITNIGTTASNVTQTGILKANLYNSGNTVLLLWFGEAPATDKQIYLNPGQGWTGQIDNKSGLHYKSVSAGGQLDYVLMG